MSTLEAFTLPPETDATGDVKNAYARVWREVRPAVKRYARSLTDDRDEREDLIQEARVALWDLDPSRCDLRNPDEVHRLRWMLAHHMSKVAKRRIRRADGVPADLKRELEGGERRTDGE